jgi:hypothetical protein
LLTAAPLAQAESFSAGLKVTEETAAEDTGLAVYPGAVLIKRKSHEGNSVNLQLAFGGFGLKVVVAKLHSDDAPGKVATFYKDDLARYGAVLDCGDAEAARAARAAGKKALSCEHGKPRAGGVLYKAGKKDDQHVVDIRAKDGGSDINLVYVTYRQPEWADD